MTCVENLTGLKKVPSCFVPIAALSSHCQRMGKWLLFANNVVTKNLRLVSRFRTVPELVTVQGV